MPLPQFATAAELHARYDRDESAHDLLQSALESLAAHESALAAAEAAAETLQASEDSLVALLRDVAGMLPVAERLHPADRAALQARVLAAIASPRERDAAPFEDMID